MADETTEIASELAFRVSKEWVQDPSPDAEQTRWRNTRTGEYRYQPSQPGERSDGDSSETGGEQRSYAVEEAINAPEFPPDSFPDPDTQIPDTKEELRNSYLSIRDQPLRDVTAGHLSTIRDGSERGYYIRGTVWDFSEDDTVTLTVDLDQWNPDLSRNQFSHEFGHVVMDAAGYGTAPEAVEESMEAAESAGRAYSPFEKDHPLETYHLSKLKPDRPSTEELDRLVEATNEAWERGLKQIQEGKTWSERQESYWYRGANEYAPDGDYSMENANEFFARAHGVLQGGTKDNFFRNPIKKMMKHYPDFMRAYIGAFDPAPEARRVINSLNQWMADQPDIDPVWDENPYPEDGFSMNYDEPWQETMSRGDW